MVDPANYDDGRGQALVKHTFLDRYIRDQLYKVGHFGTFAYVDLFAGPWQARSADYSDTSFGIALQRMREAKAKLASLGKQVRMIAHLVEKDNFAELEAAVVRFPEIEVTCHRGRAEDHANAIAAAIPASAFRFVVIDPKGLNDVREFAKLISAPRTEVLLNFMFQFANRFVATNRMPRLIEWLSTVAPGPDWQARVEILSGEEREQYVTDMARAALVKMGEYDFAPAITVDEAETNRTLYKLIFLTRHPLGLRVFRDAQVAALEVQAGHRSKLHADKRQEKTGQGDMFTAAGLTDPGERSAKLLTSGRRRAERRALELIDGAPEGGILWKLLWTVVLDEEVVTYRDLSDAVAGWHKTGRVTIQGLAPKARTPKDDLYITR